MSDNNGWIKLHRKMTNWEWYKDGNVFRVFTHLILKANHKDGKWQGQVVKRGQLITSIPNLSTQLSNRYNKLSIQQVRTALHKLKSTGEITVKTTSKYSLVTINNYDAYQQDNSQDNASITDNQQTSNSQITTNKNVKNKKNEKKYIYIYATDEVVLDLGKYFKDVIKKGAGSPSSWRDNLEFWLKTYTLEQIKTAIRNIPYWWGKDSASLTLVLRTKNKAGNADYINELLNVEVPSNKFRFGE